MSPHNFSTLLDALASAKRQENEIKGMLIGSEEIQLDLFSDDVIFYVENLKESTKLFLEEVTKASYKDTGLIHKNPSLFCISVMNKRNLRGEIQHQSTLAPKKWNASTHKKSGKYIWGKVPNSDEKMIWKN